METSDNTEELAITSDKWVARLRLLWSHRRFVVCMATIGAVVSAASAFAIPKYYTTSTRLMPPDPQSPSNMMMLAGMADKAGNGLGSVAGDLLGLKSSGALFVGMLQSQTIEDQLVQQFDLKRIYGTPLLEDARGQLNQNTSIQEDRKSGIITITVSDKSPQRAAAIANGYVIKLNSMVSQLSTSSAHRERVFLEGRLESVKADLNEAEMQLAQFSSKNNTIDIQQQEKAMLEATATLAGQLIAAQSELEGLRQIYTDENARVRSLNARVAELRKELDKLSGQPTPGQNHNTWGATLQTADPVSISSANMPYPSTRNLPLLGVEYADYYRHTKIQETVYELLTEQNELAKVEEAKETPSVKVLDPAEIPEAKSSPHRSVILLMGTLIAIGLSMFAIFGAAWWQHIAPEDQRKVLAQDIGEAVKGHFVRASENAMKFAVVQRLVRWVRRDSSGAHGSSVKI